MNLTRRRMLQLSAGAGAAGLALPGTSAFAQKSRSLSLQIQGFSLAIHIPEVIALREGLLELGYAEPKIDRTESMQVITQSIVAASAEAGDAMSSRRCWQASAAPTSS